MTTNVQSCFQGSRQRDRDYFLFRCSWSPECTGSHTFVRKTKPRLPLDSAQRKHLQWIFG